MLNKSELLALFMNRLAEEGVFTDESEFYAANLEPAQEKKDFWIQESFSGDTLHRETNKRYDRLYPTVYYTVFVPYGTGTAVLDEKEGGIKNCFDLWDEAKYNFAGDGFAGEVRSIKVSDDFSNGIWCGRTIAINLSVHLY